MTNLENNLRLRVAFVGFGYWSPKLMNGFRTTGKADIVAICEKDESRWPAVKQALPELRIFRHYKEMVRDPNIDAVIITTVVSSHFRIARAALAAGKHVLVEKPMTETVAQAKELVRLAAQKRLVLMVDHTFMYAPAVQMLKEVITSGTIGNVHTVVGARTNLGLFQKDIDVIYDLAPHDFSIMHFIFGDMPKSVHVESSNPLRHPRQPHAFAAAAFTTLHYPERVAHFIHSWISPTKDRRMVFVGDKGMVVYDMLDQVAPVRIFDSRIEILEAAQPYDPYFAHISGEGNPVNIPTAEGDDLSRVATEFINAIRERREALTSGAFGLAVVRMLAQASNKSGIIDRFKRFVRHLK
jgi:predicted dehydrogenase